MSSSKLETLRSEIAEIDAVLMAHLAKRQKIAKQIGRLKADLQLPVLDAQREHTLLEYHEKLSIQHGLSPEWVRQLFSFIIAQSRAIQQSQQAHSPESSVCLRVASIVTNHPDIAKNQIQQVTPFADLIELRLDCWESLQLSDIAALRDTITKPVLFTLRKKSQGGYFALTETERLYWLVQLATLEPDYMDIEFDVDMVLVEMLKQQHSSIKFIRSYHDFSGTPKDLMALWQQIHHPLFDLIKLATWANDLNDALRLLIFTRAMSQKQAIITMAMGEYGQVSRILAPVCGSQFVYGSVSSDTHAAPGQITLAELTQCYRVSVLNQATQIYALLGDPVAQSPGHFFHNQVFAEKQKNAVYVKLRTSAETLGETFALLRQLPVEGMSVTIPHKETIVPYLDVLIGDAALMQVVNTVKRQGNNWQGYNTDGMGAVDVLVEQLSQKQQSLKNSRILILGAGGSAKAIAIALIHQGAQVTLCNRTLARAQAVIEQHGGNSLTFDQLMEFSLLPYDMVINTLPKAGFEAYYAQWSFPPSGISNNAVAMDIILDPCMTLFLMKAKASGWTGVAGDALFHAQAKRQLALWFDSTTYDF